MQRINIPGVGIVQFPDSMSDEQIDQAIQRDILPSIRGATRVAPTMPMDAGRPTSPPSTAEQAGRSSLQRNIFDPVERGFQNLMIGAAATRALSPDSLLGLDPEEAAAAIARRQRRLAEIPRTEASQRAFREAEEAESIPGAVGRLAGSSAALGDIGLESLGTNPLAAPVGALANVTPVPVLRQAIGALAGALGFPTEYLTSVSNGVMEAAQSRGVDVRDPRQLSALLREINANPELRGDIRSDALVRAGIISAADAAAGYGAGRVVTRGVVGRVGGGAGIEAAGGGLGEAGAQLATEGRITSPAEIAAEIIGGGGMGALGNIRQSPTPGQDPALQAAIEQIVRARGGAQPAPGTIELPGGEPPAEPAAEVPAAAPVAEPAVVRQPDLLAQPEQPARPEVAPPVAAAPEALPAAPAPAETAAPRDLLAGVGAPAPAPAAPQAETFNIPVGRQFAVSTPDGSMSVDVVPEVVDLFSLNPATGALQNRMIDNPANQATINNIANAPDFTRLGTSPYSDRGAPIIGPDNVIEIGNHRVEGLKRAAENNPQAYQGYVRALNEAGYDTSGMQFPVLVRRRVGELDPAKRQDFTRLSNTEANQSLSDLELAKQDASRLTPELLSKFDGEVSGGVRAAKNLPFVRDFLSQITTPSERTRLISPEGGISDALADRLERALFASAYNDIALIKRAVETGDDDTKSITGGMIEATGAMQELRRGIDSGRIRPEFDIVQSLVKAADRIRAGKANQLTPADILATEDMLNPIPGIERELIGLLSNDSMNKIASKSAIGKRLKAFVEEAKTQTTDQDLVGGERRITPEEAAVTARNPGQASMFSARATDAGVVAEAPAVKAKRERAQEKARRTVNKFLDDLRSRGRQSRIFASDLDRLLRDRTMTAEQIYRGFMVADTLAKTIPARADYRLKFVQDLVVDNEDAGRASGAEMGQRAQGRVVYPEEGSAGLIELSLAKDMLPYLNETAAHEGFHILQTYFAEYDKAFADRINKSFKEDMKISDLEPSIKRRLQALKPPGSKVSYYDSLVQGLGDKPLSVKEAQAYAFGSLVDASMRGKPTAGILPPFQRFVLFAKEFLAKLKSALNKDGFESPADLLLSAQRRGARMVQEAPTEGGSTYSARRVPDQYAARATGQVAGLPAFGQRVNPQTPSGTQQAELNVQYDVVSRALSKRLGRFISPAKIESFFMKFQDKMLPVGRMIDDVRAAGGNVAVAMDAYLKEDLMQGKVAALLEWRKKNLYDPLVNAIADSGLSIQDFENFLYARHAPERNRYIASINPDMPDGGSGLTNKQAEEMMKEFQQQGKTAKLTELAKMFDKIIEDTNRVRVEAGLTPDFSQMTMTEDGRLLPNWEFYAPLRNFVQESVDGSETVKEFRPKTGKALGARGREDRRVTGRERLAGDILAHAMMQNTQSVIRGEQNKVGQSFLALIRANPEQTKDLAQVISSAPLRTTIVDGIVKTMPDPFYKNDPDVLVVKESGKEVAIRIFDDNVARAMTGASALSPTSQNILVQGMAAVNRFLAKVNTAYNPEFLITNFARDLQTFGINVQQFDIDGLTRDVMGDLKGSLSGIRDVTRGTNNNPEMARYFERFRELGGTTDMYGFADIETRIAEINETMNKVGTEAKSWKEMAQKATGPVIKLLEDYNTIVENGVRTALFKNLVERGFNEEKAAQAAKNITVNFSKGGEHRVFMNALYLFYNASLQGSMAMMNAIGRSPKVRKIVAGVVVAGVLQDVINSMLSDVDDDEEKVYDKIPDHVLKRSFVMMDPFQITDRGYFSFPMPYGFNAFFNMGREMSKAARGATSPMKAAGSIVGTFVESFNPIGGSENLYNFVAPTIADPFIDLARNRDFAGRPIVPERGGFGPQVPESQKFWNNTFAPYVTAAQFLNELTGGTRVIPGAVDISPSIIQYAVNYLTGGVGKFVERTYNTATGTIPDALRGDLEDLDVKGIPLARSLYGTVTKRSDTERYMERMEEVLRVRQEIRDAGQYGQTERIDAAMRRYPGQVEIMEAFSRISRERAQLSQQINAINRNPNIDADSKKEIIKLLRDQQNALVGVANQLYNQSVERRQ